MTAADATERTRIIIAALANLAHAQYFEPNTHVRKAAPDHVSSP
jgi:hypothetical protein